MKKTALDLAYGSHKESVDALRIKSAIFCNEIKKALFPLQIDVASNLLILLKTLVSDFVVFHQESRMFVLIRIQEGEEKILFWKYDVSGYRFKNAQAIIDHSNFPSKFLTMDAPERATAETFQATLGSMKPFLLKKLSLVK